MKKILATLLMLPLFASAQNQISKLIPQVTNAIKTDTGYIVSSMIVDGDTAPVLFLYKIVIFPKRKFRSKREYKRYTRLERNIRTVYPYAKLINLYYYEIEQELQYIPPEKQKEYLKKKEKELRSEFEEKLINLTVSQGRLLIKLVDRETNHTTYEVIQEFKGNMQAVFWQSIARIFGSNLKSEYDPDEEDRMIEEIIAKIENGE